jgi:hypothetical protein
MIKNYVFFFVLSWCFVSLAFAEPSPFGITIKQTTIEDLRQKYSVKNAGTNKYSDGPMYDLNPSEVGLEGVESVRVIFSRDNKVLAVITTCEKTKYNDLFKNLSSKYNLSFNKEPFVGDKVAEFTDDQTKISLSAPHMSFELSLNYIHKDLQVLFDEISINEEQQKTAKEVEKL